MEKRTSQAVLPYQPDGLCQTMNAKVSEQITSIYFMQMKKKLRCQHHTKSQRQTFEQQTHFQDNKAKETALHLEQ